MYEKKEGQISFLIPFGGQLNPDNRWVKLAHILLWEEIEDKYAKSFQKECEHRIIRYSRCDSFKKSWANICRKTGIKDLQFKDLRRYFNKRVLQDRLGFSLHEAGWYIGNSKEVNEKHYSPITAEMLALKLTGQDQMSLINPAKN